MSNLCIRHAHAHKTRRDSAHSHRVAARAVNDGKNRATRARRAGITHAIHPSSTTSSVFTTTPNITQDDFNAALLLMLHYYHGNVV